jgi:hypothetical protein
MNVRNGSLQTTTDNVLSFSVCWYQIDVAHSIVDKSSTVEILTCE